VASVAIGLANVVTYSPTAGYDAQDHIDYARGLVWGGHLPHGEGEYYTPPGYYAVAGVALRVASHLGVAQPEVGAMFLNVFFLLGTIVLVRQIARELFPGRERLAVAAAAFVAFVPVTVKAEAMFHPELLSLFGCTLALWLCVRTLADRRYVWALGVALGAIQLVRAFTLWTVGAVVLALLAGRRFRELAIVVLIAIAIPAPWYVHQRNEYGGSPAFAGRPTTAQGREGNDVTAAPKPIWERRPVRFYVDPGVPEVITKPWRRNFLNLALPTTYSEIWGDYFGIWEWNGTGEPPARARGTLQRQSVVGLLPTLLAVAGWLALLVATLRSPRRLAPQLAVVLLPAIGILGYLYFTVSYPTPDGDVLKGTYLLTTAPGCALGFGYALDRLPRRLFLAAVALLVVCLLVELPFLVY
jgi:hypothetical protein